jgi:hypothetical protein
VVEDIGAVEDNGVDPGGDILGRDTKVVVGNCKVGIHMDEERKANKTGDILAQEMVNDAVDMEELIAGSRVVMPILGAPEFLGLFAPCYCLHQKKRRMIDPD